MHPKNAESRRDLCCPVDTRPAGLVLAILIGADPNIVKYT